MQQTQEDIKLLNCLLDKVTQFKQNILHGRPYVWELRLSLNEFYELESAINNSIASHSGLHNHLLTEDFALIVVIYLAEWYKRYYKGADTMDENKVLALNTEELKQLYELAGIDKNTFVYNASKNPDKTSFRWQESLQVLGGLAVQAELKRDQSDELLPKLCKIFHEEEIDLDDLKDRNRAVAFQESIAQHHSLYEYLKCILEKGENGHRNLPFAPSDITNEDTCIPQLISRIESADELATKHKFNFEWLISYTASRNTMVRHLKVKLKPEPNVTDERKKQYLGYDRLRKPEWGIANPENVGRISFYLRFKNGGHYVQKEQDTDEPLFKYHNTNSEKTGFVCVNKEDENTFTNVPVARFDKVEIVMKYHDTYRIVQELPVKDYMQVYALPKKANKFSNRRNSQVATAVIFSSAYHLADGYQDLTVVYAHYRNGEECSEDYCWCPINDKVVLADQDGNEVLPPFFNRNGLYQVVTKKYLHTIKYKENVYVLYKYIDADYDEEEEQEDNLPVMFGRNGLEVRHYPSGQSKDSELVPATDYSLEWLNGSRYMDWDKEQPPQGAVRLRVTVKGLVFKLQVFYVPFSPSDTSQAPIWRDFEHMRICTALEGVDDIQDDFRDMTEKQPDTRQLEIGDEMSKILVEVYRPIKLRELSQKKSGEKESHVLSCLLNDENIEIPLINCEQFTVRDFSEKGVKEYQLGGTNTMYYNFPTFDQPGVDGTSYLLQENASKLNEDVPLDYLKIYITKALDKASELYSWNYKDDPQPTNNSSSLIEEGIVFQSLKDNDSPRHYAMPTIKKGKGGWGGKKAILVVDALYCFETVAEHGAYFFLFNPLIKIIAAKSQVKEILLPLIRKRDYTLTESDIDNLYRFALQFHFDWMLLPRYLWTSEIDAFATSVEEHNKLKETVISFFMRTPKCTDEREQACLKEFLKVYWTFDAYPKVYGIAEVALKLIQGENDALQKYHALRDYLKIYDECRFKFIEMSKALCTTDNN